jgi:hypothetical protein
LLIYLQKSLRYNTQGVHKKNCAVSKVNKKFVSRLTRAYRTPSAASTVQVSHVRVLLNRFLQQRWNGRAVKGDNHLLPWPPRSPDLTQYDFFLWGFVKASLYVPPLSMSLKELGDRITYTLQTITENMLHQVWDESDYPGKVYRVTQGAQVEGLCLTHEKLGQLLLLLTVCVVTV